MISARNAARLRAALPAVALAGLLVAVISQQPRAASYFGLNLLLNLRQVIPDAIAAAQS